MRASIAATALLAIIASTPPESASASDIDRCLAERSVARVARVASPAGELYYTRVVSDSEGIPTGFSPIAKDGTNLATVFERASETRFDRAGTVWKIADEQRAVRILAPIALTQAEIDAEQRVVVAPGLNYAAHAEEAGGGDVFIFPKPSAPTSPYADLERPAHVKLLDYEVELAFVLLSDVELRKLPSREALLATIAFFVANDVSDREPIIQKKALFGPGTGFVEAKGQPGFLPAGPWMVRGSELFAAVAACGADGLGIELAVDRGSGFRPRQASRTERMILDPLELVARIANEVEQEGLRTAMPLLRDGRVRYYPLAVGGDSPRLPAGSVILTGTPDGVAIQAPNSLAVALRGLWNLRSPFEQFRSEELARAASAEDGGYLRPGDLVRASIDGLGAQLIRITQPSSTAR